MNDDRRAPAWVKTSGPGMDVLSENIEGRDPGFAVDIWSDDNGLAEYTLWTNGDVTLVHHESGTYRLWIRLEAS